MGVIFAVYLSYTINFCFVVVGKIGGGLVADSSMALAKEERMKAALVSLGYEPVSEIPDMVVDLTWCTCLGCVDIGIVHYG